MNSPVAVLGLALLLGLGSSCTKTNSSPGADSTSSSPGAESTSVDSGYAVALVPAINAFAVELHGALRSTPGNVVDSPLSISTALGMLFAGSAGGTRAEMRRVLHLPADEARVSAGYGALFTLLELRTAVAGSRWTLANRVWVQEGMTLRPAFVATTRDGFRSEAGTLDFARSPEPARAAMNRWIEEKTQDRIRDLFPAGSITPATRVVLANAIYFTGLWAKPFAKERTRPVPFHVAGGAGAPVPTMFATEDLPLVRIAGARLVDLPYVGETLSMTILLPDSVGGLTAIEERLDADSLRAWTAGFSSARVELGLPRFKVTSRLELTGPLSAMGMPSAFDESTADFSGMSGKRDLFVSLVAHQAFVEVNEEGTEAAAATGIVMRTTSAPLLETFLVDRPFLFFIRDRSSGLVLFMGRVVDPRS